MFNISSHSRAYVRKIPYYIGVKSAVIGDGRVSEYEALVGIVSDHDFQRLIVRAL